MQWIKRFAQMVLTALTLVGCGSKPVDNEGLRIALEGRVERNKDAWGRVVSFMDGLPTPPVRRQDYELVMSGTEWFSTFSELHLILRSNNSYSLSIMGEGRGLGEEDYQRVIARMGQIYDFAQEQLGGQRHGSRRYDETDVGAVNADIQIPVDAAMAQQFIDALGALIGALASLPGAFADIGLCLAEEGKRVIPWILGEMYQANPEGLECSSRCVASSSVPLSGWCVAHSADFIRAGGHLEVAPGMRDYVMQVCSDILDNDPSDPNYICVF